MQKIKLEPFMLIGITVETTNQNGQAAKDIPQLWERFVREQIQSKIPNRVNGEIVSAYTHYEGDYMQPYTTLMGCRVSSLEEIPDGMSGHRCEGGEYLKFIAKGNLQQGAVIHTWMDIWNRDLDRSYTTDFETYGAKAQNPEDAEVDIFVAVKE